MTNPMNKEAELKKVSVRQMISQIANAFEHALSSGEQADLRRLAPHEPASPTFYKIAALFLEPNGFLPSGEPFRLKSEQKWACILAGIALLQGLHEPNRNLGTALAEAGYSELRFVRLLRAQGESLFEAVRGAVRYLASKGAPVDVADFANLLLSEGLDHAEEARRTIARSYYSAINENKKEGA